MYNIIYETSLQSRFDARYWMLGAGALGRPRGMVWRGKREEGSGWGTHVDLWRIHFDIWQNQYNIVKLKKKKNCWSGWPFPSSEYLPDLGIEPMSSAWQACSLPLSHLESSTEICTVS